MNSSLPAPKANMTMAAYWAIISTHVAAVSSPIVVTHPVVTATVSSAPLMAAPTVMSAPLMAAPKPIVATFNKYDDYEERYADYKEQLYWEHR
jgi:hypothetical protein